MAADARTCIIVGPTASGKSDLALALARRYCGEIINADSVQMYAAVSVGTAKPDWHSSDIPHHLFDILSTPVLFDVVAYRQAVSVLVSTLGAAAKLPVIVGGSLFYVKSLLYPPRGFPEVGAVPEALAALSHEALWQHLATIDQARANQLNPADRYRVERALAIWYRHGVLPSHAAPHYVPPFSATIFYLNPPPQVLTERIKRRTEQMIAEGGWIAEARALAGNVPWRTFIEERGFIGYRELFAWVDRGEPAAELAVIVDQIALQTCQYAKRQRTFWNSFYQQVLRDSPVGQSAIELHQLSDLERYEQEACAILS